MRLRLFVFANIAAVVLAVGCATAPPPSSAPAPVVTTASGGETARPAAPAPVVLASSSRRTGPLPNDIHWFRAAAEYRALARQAYETAGDRLPVLSKGLPKRSWVVVLDADETVLDNSEYQRRRWVADSGYTDASWEAWVNERAARPIPGAADFTKRVRALGGRVAIVTNRTEKQCEATRANLKSAGVDADIVLCQPLRERDKNPRFQRLEKGTAVTGVPPLKIVEWIGDNITDFPGMSQIARSEPTSLNEFGRRYFMLPNPMYGSWQSNRDP